MHSMLEGPSFSRHDNPKKLIIMLHGYGDNASNFINLAKPMDQEEWSAHYIALNAPKNIPNYPEGYEWFNIYPNGIYISEAGSKEIIIIKKEVMNSVLKIQETIKYHLNKLKLTFTDCVIIGFSQGGIIAFEVGNYLQVQLGGLAILSGRIINKEKITNSNLLKTPIFISHGTYDDVLPIKNFEYSIEYLKKNKCNFESHLLNGDTHTISQNTINLLQKFIKKNL